jgi:hypothetical protein
MTTDLESKQAALRQLEESISDTNQQLDACPDVSEEILVVTQRISDADIVHKSIEPWIAWDRAMLEKKTTHEAIQELTSKLKTLESEEKKLLADSGIPVEGLSFSEDGEPLLNERSLSVASGREKIDMAVTVAMAAGQLLKVCLLDEANDLDDDALELLDERGKALGFQLWIARIAKEGGGEIVVEDGVARSAEKKGDILRLTEPAPRFEDEDVDAITK